MTLLCGSAPLLDGAPVAAEPGDGIVLLTIRDGDLVQRLEVGPGAALLSARQREAFYGTLGKKSRQLNRTPKIPEPSE